MKGDGESWEDFNKPITDRINEAIATAKRGDDAYRRWPVDLLEHVSARMAVMQDTLDARK